MRLESDYFWPDKWEVPVSWAVKVYFCIFSTPSTSALPAGQLFVDFCMIRIHHQSWFSDFIWACKAQQYRNIHSTAQAIIIIIDWFKNKHRSMRIEKTKQFRWSPRWTSVWLTGCEAVNWTFSILNRYISRPDNVDGSWCLSERENTSVFKSIINKFLLWGAFVSWGLCERKTFRFK